MARLVTSTGVVVHVDDELGERLASEGYTPAGDEQTKKAPAKKAAASKPEK
jgi:hypothetical protein